MKSNKLQEEAISILTRLNQSDSFAMGKVDNIIKKEAENWLTTYRAQYNVLTDKELLFIIRVYDPIHRLATGKQASRQTMHSMSDRLLKSYLRGKSGIEKNELIQIGNMANPGSPIEVSPGFRRWLNSHNQ